MMRNVADSTPRWSTLRDESGQDLLEYALLVGLISLVALGAVGAVGTTIDGVFWAYIAGVISGI
jgi:Flp pilus assembly pilin Flp